MKIDTTRAQALSRYGRPAAVVGVVVALIALVFYGGGGLRGVNDAYSSVIGMFVCQSSDYSAIEAFESDDIHRAARNTFSSGGDLETSCDPDDRTISADLPLSSSDPWEVVSGQYQELMSSNGWTEDDEIPLCYQKEIEGRHIGAYPLLERRADDGSVKFVIAFSSRSQGCTLLSDPDLA